MSGRSVILSTLFLDKPPRDRLPVLSAHSFAINRQLLFLNQQKRKNGRRNIFMTKSSQKNVPDPRIDRGAACFPSDIPTDRAIAPDSLIEVTKQLDRVVIIQSYLFSNYINGGKTRSYEENTCGCFNYCSVYSTNECILHLSTGFKTQTTSMTTGVLNV